MTNRIAIWLFLGLVLAYALTALVVDDLHVFLGRKFLELTQWIAFWR